MNITTENLGEQHQIVRFNIEDADYRDRFEKALKELAKKAQIPGFRQGHVPPGMIKKMYGETVILDELYKIVNEQMTNYLKTNNFDLLGDALPVANPLDINFNENKSYEFAYEIGLQPSISLESNINKDKTFTRYKIEAKEEEIDAELERIQRKYGERKDVETVEENDVVYAHAHELNDDDSVMDGGIHADTYFNLQMLNEGYSEIFLGAKPGDIKNISDIFSVFKGDRLKVAKNILQLSEITEEGVADINPKFEFKIERIARLFPAEVNEQFFESIGKEFPGVTNIEELKTMVKEAIEVYNSRVTEVALENDMFKYLGDTTNVALPEVFLRKWFRQSNEKEITEDNFEVEFTDFITKLKQSLIYRHIQKSHDLNVSNDELIQEAIATVNMSYGQMGEEFVQYITQNQLKDKKFVENMHDRVAQKKFFEALKGYVTIEDQIITAEEFQKLNKQEEVYAE
ncbi:MAG: trigger factor [Chitinophagales bacterium]